MLANIVIMMISPILMVALGLLKANGYNTNKIRTDKILSESTLTKLRRGQGVSWDNLETICKLTNSRIEDIIEYVSDENVKD